MHWKTCSTHLLLVISFSLKSLLVIFFITCLAEMDACFSTQLIDGDGVFNVSGLENFMKEVKMGECGLSYAVVSIMGPQSSGMVFFFSFHHLLYLFSMNNIFYPSAIVHQFLFTFFSRKEYTFKSPFPHQFQGNGCLQRKACCYSFLAFSSCLFSSETLLALMELVLILNQVHCHFLNSSGHRLPKVYGWRRPIILNHALL